mmetsp:Transcript_57236/g.131142  ORF Transcript_57236/g.131142 Transcript_57236/m.131142 type:complete len:449 (-) Transcript_57236:959-2305(-)
MHRLPLPAHPHRLLGMHALCGNPGFRPRRTCAAAQWLRLQRKPLQLRLQRCQAIPILPLPLRRGWSGARPHLGNLRQGVPVPERLPRCRAQRHRPRPVHHGVQDEDGQRRGGDVRRPCGRADGDVAVHGDERAQRHRLPQVLHEAHARVLRLQQRHVLRRIQPGHRGQHHHRLQRDRVPRAQEVRDPAGAQVRLLLRALPLRQDEPAHALPPLPSPRHLLLRRGAEQLRRVRQRDHRECDGEQGGHREWLHGGAQRLQQSGRDLQLPHGRGERAQVLDPDVGRHRVCGVDDLHHPAPRRRAAADDRDPHRHLADAGREHGAALLQGGRHQAVAGAGRAVGHHGHGPPRRAYAGCGKTEPELVDRGGGGCRGVLRHLLAPLLHHDPPHHARHQGDQHRVVVRRVDAHHLPLPHHSVLLDAIALCMVDSRGGIHRVSWGMERGGSPVPVG